jgi:undecaprenyl phosphate N,N'-diacetylbacillosamine 1-phosphate transferase
VTPRERVGKRAIDLVVGGLMLVAASPLLLLIPLAIRLSSPGPSLFRQRRVGQDGRLFTCYKFRTMYVDAPDMWNADGSAVTSGDDPRVTAIGRFLRKSSLDELPQLINVLKGEMSLVGPRPELPSALERYSQRQRTRLVMPPGITGWAAIHGRNDLPWNARLELDLDYVARFSLRLDLYILLCTVLIVLRATGVNDSGRRGAEVR